MRSRLEILRDLKMRIVGSYSRDIKLYTVIAIPKTRGDKERPIFHIEARSSYLAMHVASRLLRDWCLKNEKLSKDYDLFLIDVAKLPF